jgi:hypothetical protein
MPYAIKPNDTVSPKQDNIEIALKERSVAIEAINFMVPPFLSAQTGREGAFLEQKSLWPIARHR